MGACLSGENHSQHATKDQMVRSKAIDQHAEAKKKQEKKQIKLLLLGAGDSGKSTILKQIIHLYGVGFSEDKLKLFTKVVYSNVVKSIKDIVENSDILGEQHFAERKIDCRVTPQNEQAKQTILTLDYNEELNPELGSIINQLWNDQGIQNTLLFRASFNLLDNAEHFFREIHRICHPEYIPTYQDVIRVRYRTTGIVETDFVFKDNAFKVFDVGGQRNERKKWIHCFENCKAVMFVAAVSEFDQVLFENEDVNRMTEALNLFEEICNSRWFKQTAMILFLNKSDVLREKIQRVPITMYEGFRGYDGPQADFGAVCDFIGKTFEERNNMKGREVYTHVTCATDSKNVDHVFNSVRDIVIRHALRTAGLVK